MSSNMALSLVNKLHSYLAQNISAATILPSEFAEKQYAFGWLTLPRCIRTKSMSRVGHARAAAKFFKIDNRTQRLPD